MSPSTEPSVATAGFTLIEALVALSIVAITLSSIGSLIASAARGNRSIESHFAVLETARTLMTALPDRKKLTTGRISGSISQQQWQIIATPFVDQAANPRFEPAWAPQSIVISVRSPTGAAIELRTIRLQRRSGK